jgi:hypothetical protein
MMHCLGCLCTAWCPGSASLVHLPFCTTLHCLESVLHRAVSWQCTAHAQPFCTALHYLGLLCTAQASRSAPPVHCFFLRRCTVLDRFAPRRVLGVHRPCTTFFTVLHCLGSLCIAQGSRSAPSVHCLFLWRCTSLDRFAPRRVLGCTAYALPFCIALDYLGSFCTVQDFFLRWLLLLILLHERK